MAYDAVRTRLPSSWTLESITSKFIGAPAVDAVWELRGPDNSVTHLNVDAVKQLEPGQVERVLNRLTHLPPPGLPFVSASFLSPRTRELLANASVSYVDATGNLRLQVDAPAVYIETAGATSDPWRDNRSIRSLKGPAAGRAVRALSDFRPPYGIVELAKRSKTPPSSISRVASFLDREALLTRTSRGTVTDVAWPRLIHRWTQDYSLQGSNRVVTALEPRGHDALLEKLRGADWPYAVTASLAANVVAPYAAARLAVVYVADFAQAVDLLRVRPVDAGTNLLLVEPYDPVVFDRTTVHDGVTYAALSQVAADLLTSPGRGPAEGEELVRWMEEHEDRWRY
ncbi:MAG: hypothetical protein JWO59_1927 [Chloroflexi bacterium]|nr:hypothetical protein [Chloroflexota bacterium]